MKNKQFKAELYSLTSKEQVQEKLEVLRQEYFKISLQKANGRVANTGQFGILRKNIARVLTYLKHLDNHVRS